MIDSYLITNNTAQFGVPLSNGDEYYLNHYFNEVKLVAITTHIHYTIMGNCKSINN
jgi:hypothetical protein